MSTAAALPFRNRDRGSETIQRLSGRDWTRTRPARVCDIIRRAAERHWVTPIDVLRGPQTSPIVAARRAAICELRLTTKLSLSMIGKYMGGLHHTTVLHHLKKELQSADPGKTRKTADPEMWAAKLLAEALEPDYSGEWASRSPRNEPDAC